MTNYLLLNATVYDPDTNLQDKINVYIKDGKIFLTNESNIPDAKPIDLTGKWILPGFVDMHVHLREPGEEHKETIETGMKCALSGGFVSIACMPNTKPVNDNPVVTSYIISKSREINGPRVYPIASITKGLKGEELTEFGELIKAGAIAFSDDGKWVEDPSIMRAALEYAKAFNSLIISHAEDKRLCPDGVMNEGVISTKLGLKGIPNEAEEIAIFRDICLAKLTNSRLHIAHISTKGSVDIIRNAKRQNILVTCEVTPHHLTLTEEECLGYNTNAKMSPPLRTQEDINALIEGLKDGTIDAIATDHAPHSVLEKEVEFDQAANGIIGLPFAFSLTLDVIRKNHLHVWDLVKFLSKNPARILGINVPTIQDNISADITVVDPDLAWKVTPEAILSKSHNTPLTGRKLIGKVIMTFVEGKLLYNET